MANDCVLTELTEEEKKRNEEYRASVPVMLALAPQVKEITDPIIARCVKEADSSIHGYITLFAVTQDLNKLRSLVKSCLEVCISGLQSRVGCEVAGAIARGQIKK